MTIKREDLIKRLEQMQLFKEKLLQDADEAQFVIDGIKRKLKEQ